MAGGGGNAAARSRTQPARGRQQTTASLPLDVLVDIAARSDPATLVRCAATCVDMRCRVKEYISLGGRLRLRHGDRFVLPLLRGHLIRGHQYDDRGRYPKEELFLVDTAAADDTTMHRATAISSVPLASRDGLVLLRVDGELRVCDQATGSSHTLPPEPAFPVRVSSGAAREISYVLLVGGECDNDDVAIAVGWRFQVVMAYLDVSQHRRCLQLQTFSSEHGTWGHYTEIRAHNLQGSRLEGGLGRALIVGGAMHWLCETNTGAYVLKLHVKTAHVSATKLPECFPRDGLHHQLLATPVAGGSPIVLTSDGDKIFAWAQSKQTTKWQQRPQVVIETEALLRFIDTAGRSRPPSRGRGLNVLWFGERSGTVLINSYWGFFWLDLQSMKIVRWFWDREIPSMGENIGYEMNLADWVPTFGSTL
ncbi:uncharacterized protein LOC119325960 [Triticum dicoccoides]|uniref:uncharacterized protein LOC119325960 n=1 Tax=Triticum dicoccoides TaxID=85692 RepID=UPI0018914313|nr:uncharacterized protein LOC119325960 [Triticum dicoccoides]